MTHQRINADLLRPLFQTSWRFYLLVGVFGSIVLIALVAWLSQAYFGFGVTGITWPIYWGFYVTNFVFWIGISHAGTLISAILRLVDAGWRRPVTRCAEVITVFALMIGAMFPIIHLGRPWLAFWLFPYPSERLIWPNFRSPLVWDFFAINTYLTGSLLFLFLPMIPDFAVVRDKATGLRKTIYRVLALGWRGTPRQWHRLEAAMSIMAVAIVPVAVSVHTIVSFDFSMAPVPMWQTTIFGPYFVAGAVPHHRAVARPQVPALRLRLLPAAGARGGDRGRDVRGDDAALRALREGRPDHLDLGAQGRRTSASAGPTSDD
jgi:molybdopterin-containing oxidoreductase family membrane subunit